jgi:hypothetical protein
VSTARYALSHIKLKPFFFKGLITSGDIPLIPLYTSMAGTGKTLQFLILPEKDDNFKS